MPRRQPRRGTPRIPTRSSTPFAAICARWGCRSPDDPGRAGGRIVHRAAAALKMAMTTIRPTVRRTLRRREEALMGTTETTQPHNDIERLLQEIAASPGVQFRVDSGDNLFIVWLAGETAPRCGCHAETWWTAGTDHWHLMAQFGAVKRVRFVREPDPHAPEHETLSIRLVGANGVSS